MEPKKVIMIDEESFRTKSLEVVETMHDKGGPSLGLAAIVAFVELQCKLFHPEEVPEETEQEQS